MSRNTFSQTARIHSAAILNILKWYANLAPEGACRINRWMDLQHDLNGSSIGTALDERLSVDGCIATAR
jgi:hypothetical protein